MSHLIGNKGGAILHSGHSAMIIAVGTLLVGFLCKIGNMGQGVHIVNTPHPIMAIPEVSMADRVEIITLLLAGHTISWPSNYQGHRLQNYVSQSLKPPDKP